MPNKKDLLLIVALLLIGFILVVVFSMNKTDGKKVYVYVDGKIIKKFDIYIDIEYKIETDIGYNILVIQDGKAYIKEASCPDRICQNNKPIDSINESIICIPNKLVIEVKSE